MQNFIRTIVSGNWHPSCTLKMGAKGSMSSVVDANLLVHGLDNLRVADLSVTPLLPRYVPLSGFKSDYMDADKSLHSGRTYAPISSATVSHASRNLAWIDLRLKWTYGFYYGIG